jgi:hypothetical protein
MPNSKHLQHRLPRFGLALMAGQEELQTITSPAGWHLPLLDEARFTEINSAGQTRHPARRHRSNHRDCCAIP